MHVVAAVEISPEAVGEPPHRGGNHEVQACRKRQRPPSGADRPRSGDEMLFDRNGSSASVTPPPLNRRPDHSNAAPTIGRPPVRNQGFSLRRRAKLYSSKSCS